MPRSNAHAKKSETAGTPGDVPATIMTPNTTAHQQNDEVHDLLTAEAQRLLDQALQFGESDEAAAERIPSR